MSLKECPEGGNESEDKANDCVESVEKVEKSQTEKSAKIGYLFSIVGFILAVPIAFKVFTIFYFARLISFASVNLYIVCTVIPGLIFSSIGFGICFARRRTGNAPLGMILSVIAIIIQLFSTLLVVSCIMA